MLYVIFRITELDHAQGIFQFQVYVLYAASRAQLELATMLISYREPQQFIQAKTMFANALCFTNQDKCSFRTESVYFSDAFLLRIKPRGKNFFQRIQL